MDWQRYDRVGWVPCSKHVFKHRRAILRAIRGDANAYPNCNGDADTCAKRNTHGHSNSDGNCHPNSNSASSLANPDADGYSDTRSNAKTNTNSETQSNTEVSPHPAAATVETMSNAIHALHE